MFILSLKMIVVTYCLLTTSLIKNAVRVEKDLSQLNIQNKIMKI